MKNLSKFKSLTLAFIALILAFITNLYAQVGVFYTQGMQDFDAGLYERAIQQFTEVIRLDNKHMLAYFYRGEIYRILNDTDKAIADYGQVLRLDRRNADAHYSRGIAYFNAERYAEAISDFREAQRLGKSADLRYGNRVPRQLKPGDKHFFTIQPTETGILTVETFSEIDTYGYVYDETGTMLVENDDGGEGANTRLIANVLKNKLYVILIRGFSSETHGEYQVMASFVPRTSMTATSKDNLAFDTIVSKTLTPRARHAFTVTTTQAGYVTFETFNGSNASEQNIDMYIEVYDENDRLLGEDDDSGSGTNAKITVPVEARKRYIMIARGLSDEAEGLYRVSAIFHTSPRPMPARRDPLTFDQSRTGILSEGSKHAFTVRPTQHGFVTVETTSELDLYLEAYDPDDNLIAEDDDSGVGANAKITLEVEANRTYTFIVRGLNDHIIGAYEVLAIYHRTRHPIPTNQEKLNFGQRVVKTMEAGEHQAFIVASTGGMITMETFGGELDTYLYAYDEDFDLLAEDDDSGEGNNAKLTITAEFGKRYIFVVRAYNSSASGTYQIMATFQQE